MGWLGTVSEDGPEGRSWLACVQQSGIYDPLQSVVGVVPHGFGQAAVEPRQEFGILRSLGGMEKSLCNGEQGGVGLCANLCGGVAYESGKKGKEERVRTE